MQKEVSSSERKTGEETDKCAVALKLHHNGHCLGSWGHSLNSSRLLCLGLVLFSEDVEQLFKQKEPSSHPVSNLCSLAEDYRESSLTMWKTVFLGRKWSILTNHRSIFLVCISLTWLERTNKSTRGCHRNRYSDFWTLNSKLKLRDRASKPTAKTSHKKNMILSQSHLEKFLIENINLQSYLLKD